MSITATTTIITHGARPQAPLAGMERLKDKIVLITGAAGAVGQAVAEAVEGEGGVAVTSDLAGRRAPPMCSTSPPSSTGCA